MQSKRIYCHVSSTREEYSFVGFGKSKFSRNLPGGPEMVPVNSHEISVSALYHSLENIEIPKVANQFPLWSYDQQREQAVHNIEVRSAYNVINGYLPELDREPVFEKDWITIETGTGKQMATWNGERFETRQELWNNFEKFAKSKGQWTHELEQEKNDQFSMEKSILSGDAIAGATWLSHESGLARYLQTWEKKENGHIITKQHDVGLVHGNDLSKIESKKLLESLRSRYDGHEIQDQSVSENTFLAKQKIEIKEVASLFRDQKSSSYRTDLKFNQTRGIINDASTIMFDTSRRLVHDGTSSAMALGAHVFDRIKRNIEEKNKKKNLLYKPEIAVFLNRGVEKISKKVRMLIRKKYVEFMEAKKILIFSESGAGIGAGIFALGMLARELPKSLRKIEKKRRKILRRKESHALKRMKLKRSGESRLFAAPRNDLLKKESKQHKRKKRVVFEASKRKTLLIVSRQSSVTEKKTKMKKEKSIQVIKKEKIIAKEPMRRSKKEKRLKHVIGILLHRLQNERPGLTHTVLKKKDRGGFSRKEMRNRRAEGRVFGKTEIKKKELKLQKKKEKVLVLNFSFAFSLWMLFLVDSQKRSIANLLSAQKDKIQLIDLEERNTEIGREHTGEVMHPQKDESEEPRPWILLSIIYYLSMIRESGARHSPQQKAASKKKSKKLHGNIPQSGVIFAFPS